MLTEQEQRKVELPKVNVTWFRFAHDSSANLVESYKRPTAYVMVGGIGAGKSSLGENLASHFPKVIDLFGSRDNEALAWCRSPFKDSLLFLKGVSTEIYCDKWESKNVVDMTLEDFEKYDAFVSCSAFYGDIREEWYSLARLMNKLWHRTAWEEPWCILIREASNLIYSRIALGETQQQAKNYIIYVLREMRHCGYALALDTLRWLSVDIDLRNLADFTFLKAQGIEGLPDNLKFLYRYFDPYGLMRMGVDTFAAIHRKGALGYGTFDYPPWHKEEKENLLNLFKIRIDYKDLPDLGEKGYAHVGDYEHVKIIQVRKETHESMEKIAENLGRSSRTVLKHINYHNSAVQGLGECDKCTRAKSPFTKEAIM